MVGVCKRREDFGDGELDPVLDEWSIDVEERLQFVEVDLVYTLTAEKCINRSFSVVEKRRRRKMGNTLNLACLKGSVCEEERGKNDLARVDVERGDEGVDIRLGEVCGTEVGKGLEENREARNAACFALGVDVA